MNEELGNSLILVHQYVRGLSSKLSEFISLLTLYNINPQFLCFSDISESNLCLINVENYNLGTSFCHQIYQKGGLSLYMLEKTCYTSLDLTGHCEEKYLEICAIDIQSVTNLQIIQCIQKVTVHLQNVLKVMSTSVYTGLNLFNFIRKHFLQICL
jgi:hypothetical protein